MSFQPRPRFTWRLRSRSLPLGRRTLLAGILNVTPDSFSDGNHFYTVGAATDRALEMLAAGADLIDIGGESTRPNSAPVPAGEEQSRILPVIRSILKAQPDAILSADTYHASTAELAVEAGVQIINDVSGLLWDHSMPGVIARYKPGLILMHTRGAPRHWQTLPPLPHADIIPLVTLGLAHSLHLAKAAGIAPSTIVLDPGFGFGKLGDENFTLLARIAELHQFSMPLLAGISRKKFLTAHLTEPTDSSRLQATSASHVAAILAGVHLLRVHDVPAARAAASIADAVLNSSHPEESDGHPSGVRPSSGNRKAHTGSQP
jgi:dihydropteroate synthase